MIRKAIFGGSFDPIHIGHLRFAIEAQEQLGFDEVILEPAKRSPFKPQPPIADAQMRFEMVSRAVEGSPNLKPGRFEIDGPEPSYTVKTVEHYADKDCDLWLMVGPDAIKHFAAWRDPEQILQSARIATISRSVDAIEEAAKNLPLPWRGHVDFVLMEPISVSSTVIRTKIAKGLSVRHLLPSEVEKLITQHGLYQKV
jgi:nicotinate-nucleotide adenylyltransferase